MREFRLLVALLIFLVELNPNAMGADVNQPPSAAAKIKGAKFLPMYGIKESSEPVKVESFLIDRYPVTNAQFLQFTQQHLEWASKNVNRLLADTGYLKSWSKGEDAGTFPKGQDNDPVVNVSYFAASDYCQARGGRLPKVIEWEYVAAASDKVRDASRNPEFVQQLLTWYAKPHLSGNLGSVGRNKPNYWGVYDMHGLIWEWTADFNSVFVSGDNRRDGEQLKNLFCGAGSANANDKANYAAFMRYALRSSLQGAYTMENLGFRCAYDLKKDHR